MDVQTQTQAQSAASPSAAAVPASRDSGSGALSSDFQTFLVMLTTQLKNQDPLNPLESQDFAVQLATFSGVEQQVKTNELLQSLGSGLGASGLSQLAGWVGMEALVDAPAAFAGAPLTLAPEIAPGADAAELTVTDAYGRVVSREALPLGADRVEWAGTGADGQPLPPGFYSFAVESSSSGQSLGQGAAAHFAPVTEARQGPDGIEIVLPGGLSVPASEVAALRPPSYG